jgi:nucleotide-binding universal stress UspA family protein
MTRGARPRMEHVMTNTISRILVPVDFSACSDHALKYATILASRFDARVEMLHVVEEPFAASTWSAEVYVPYMPELLTGLQKEAERRLGELRATVAAAGLLTDSAVVIGRPSQAIVERAAETHADLIVMGTHGRTGVSHLILGSVAEQVLRKAPCGVLTVKDTLAWTEAGDQTAAA